MDHIPHLSTAYADSQLIDLVDEECCPLCNRTDLKAKPLHRHFIQCHVNHKVDLGLFSSYLCKLACGDNTSSQGHYHCPNCNFTVRHKNRLEAHFGKHFPTENKQKSKPASHCVLVDHNNGVYMVSKNTKGTSVPIHVQYKETENSNVRIECSRDHCSDSMAMASSSGIVNFKCDHLKQIEAIEFVEDKWFTEGYNLDGFTAVEKEAIIPFLKNIQKTLTNPVVPWTLNKRYNYYSVIAEKNAYYTKFNRLFVKKDLITNDYFCDCRKASKISNCTHVLVTKIYEKYRNKDVLPNESEKCSKTRSSKTTSTSQKHIDYQIEFKKYPVEMPSNCLLQTTAALSKVKELIPVEEECHLCSRRTLQVIKYSSNGILLDTKIVIPGINLYYKYCETCDIKYYYKEYRDGLHLTHNSNLILTLDICLLMREGVCASTAAGRTSNILLEFMHKCEMKHSIKVNTLRECYENFEMMTDHPYKFECIICGTYPSVLMTDVCRKGFTQIPVNLLSEGNNEPRGMHEFWDDVTHQLISKENNLEKAVNHWAQWMNPNNVNEKVLSTEFQKGKQKEVILEEEVMVSEQEFVDSLKNKKKRGTHRVHEKSTKGDN